MTNRTAWHRGRLKFRANEALPGKGEEHPGLGGSGSRSCAPPLDRRAFLQGAVAGAAALTWGRYAKGDQPELGAVWAEIEKRHDEAVQRLQEWGRQTSIGAEDR